jgi:hypothetical protein
MVESGAWQLWSIWTALNETSDTSPVEIAASQKSLDPAPNSEQIRELAAQLKRKKRKDQ